MTIRGSCHCGKIAFTLDDEITEAIECNCSICRRRGAVLAASGADRFTFEGSRDDMATYTFHNHVIQHHFCRTCGCAPFAEGRGRDGSDMVMVNLRCADDFDLSTLKISPFDGASF